MSEKEAGVGNEGLDFAAQMQEMWQLTRQMLNRPEAVDAPWQRSPMPIQTTKTSAISSLGDRR
jgi:hypothetical protein